MLELSKADPTGYRRSAFECLETTLSGLSSVEKRTFADFANGQNPTFDTHGNSSPSTEVTVIDSFTVKAKDLTPESALYRASR